MTGRVKVTDETTSGRNQRFEDTKTGRNMARTEFVKKIEDGCYSNYHIRVVNGIKTPASNPDGKDGNNLG